MMGPPWTPWTWQRWWGPPWWGAPPSCAPQPCGPCAPAGTVSGLAAGPGVTLTPNPITTTGTISVSSTIPGTTTNDNAPIGFLGEYQSATAAGIGLTTNVPMVLTSLTLTAGDWDVQAVANFSNPTAADGFIVAAESTAGFTTGDRMTSVAYAALPQQLYVYVNIASPLVRFSLAATTSVNCLVQAYFTGTCTATGWLRARRMR